MKQVILSIAALVLITTLFAQKKSDDVAKFTNETIDFGKIKQAVPATATFTVTNISKEPLIIEQASPTCGCTIGDYTKEPIAPGKTGTITATYNAASPSPFEKHLTVKFAGADDVKSITIKGEVLAAEDFDKWKAGNGAPTIVKTPVAITTPVKVSKAKTAVTSKAVPVKSIKSKKVVASTTKS